MVKESELNLVNEWAVVRSLHTPITKHECRSFWTLDDLFQLFTGDRMINNLNNNCNYFELIVILFENWTPLVAIKRFLLDHTSFYEG